jgi:hypothetical protein
MGETLFETVSNFPATSSSVKFLNFVAPWAGLVHVSSKIVWKRLAFIAQVRQQKRMSNNQPINRDPFPSTDERGVMFAPDPSLAN